MSVHILKVDDEHHHTRIDAYITAELSDLPSRTFVKKLIDHGHVTVNESAVKSSYKVQEGDDVHVTVPSNFMTPQYIQPEKIPLNIFYEDESLLIINKPIGMMVHPAQGRMSGTLVNALLHHAVDLSTVNTDIRPGIVHRLDQETSGLLVVAKDNITHTKLAKQFQRHTIFKKYVAIVEGQIEFDEGRINEPIGKSIHHRERKAVSYEPEAKASVTVYRVIKRNKNNTLVALYPRTGRTHQLRVHMRHMHHPILGDSKYGHPRSFHRLALHAQALGFKHPRLNSYVEFSTLYPPDFIKKINEEG